jgi:hypothetical protein
MLGIADAFEESLCRRCLGPPGAAVGRNSLGVNPEPAALELSVISRQRSAELCVPEYSTSCFFGSCCMADFAAEKARSFNAVRWRPYSVQGIEARVHHS